jgi:3-deoxy-manno-octulosonate cytidylyltransferase (CMP-KDO synthetase)
MKNKVLVIIPARLASRRLPNKPMADIAGKTMIRRVYEQAIAANLGDVLIACDGEEIAGEVRKFKGKFVITSPDLPSGTDRIYVGYKNFIKEAENSAKNYEVIVNLQGDLPNIDPQVICDAAKIALENNDCDIATVACKISDITEITNPNVVKISLAFKEKDLAKALYFSRCPIPFSKDNSADFYHHIGIYAYKKKALTKFVNLAPSILEKRESLEQLRALENDMKILVKIVNCIPLSVDTKEDLKMVTRTILKKSNV